MGREEEERLHTDLDDSRQPFVSGNLESLDLSPRLDLPPLEARSGLQAPLQLQQTQEQAELVQKVSLLEEKNKKSRQRMKEAQDRNNELQQTLAQLQNPPTPTEHSSARKVPTPPPMRDIPTPSSGP